MIKLDDDLLKELGLAGLPPEEKRKLLAHVYETLEMRVGMKLAEQMSDAQLAEFEQFIDSNNEAGALQWLEMNFPNYKDVVAAEFEKLKSEIAQVAPQILVAAQQAQAAAPQQYAPQPAQPPMPPHPQQPMAPQYTPPQPYTMPDQQPVQPTMPPQQPQYPGQGGQQPYPGQAPAGPQPYGPAAPQQPMGPPPQSQPNQQDDYGLAR
jgi:hypothetical protein